MARILFLAFESAGQTHVIKALRNAGHKVALSEPRAAEAHTLVRQQLQPFDHLVCDASQRTGQAREAVAYLRGLSALRSVPLLVYNVKADDEPAWKARLPEARLERGDDVLRSLEPTVRDRNA